MHLYSQGITVGVSGRTVLFLALPSSLDPRLINCRPGTRRDEKSPPAIHPSLLAHKFNKKLMSYTDVVGEFLFSLIGLADGHPPLYELS
jgi:hypothetical protein